MKWAKMGAKMGKNGRKNGQKWAKKWAKMDEKITVDPMSRVIEWIKKQNLDYQEGQELLI